MVVVCDMARMAFICNLGGGGGEGGVGITLYSVMCAYLHLKMSRFFPHKVDKPKSDTSNKFSQVGFIARKIFKNINLESMKCLH